MWLNECVRQVVMVARAELRHRLAGVLVLALSVARGLANRR